MNFDFIFLGQSILKYQVPLEIFVGLNELYETQKKHLPNAGKQLAGKIPDEVSLFYAGPTNKKMHTHSYVSEDILKWFYSIFKHYLDWNKTIDYTMEINSIWINEMILKLPKDYGPEPARPDQPMNGQLQIMGSASGQFVKADYSPQVKIGDFYVFPYDMRHVVYPFTNKKAKRRTLVCNMDVAYDLVASRTAQ
jgi:hypothetical protein